MNEEEKKAIGQCKLLLNGEITLHVIGDDGGTVYCGTVNKEYNKDLETILNLIEKQQKELEKLKDRDYISDLENQIELASEELEKKDKIIDKMAEMLVKVPENIDEPEKLSLVHFLNEHLEEKKQRVINYILNLVEKEN